MEFIPYISIQLITPYISVSIVYIITANEVHQFHTLFTRHPLKLFKLGNTESEKYSIQIYTVYIFLQIKNKTQHTLFNTNKQSSADNILRQTIHYIDNSTINILLANVHHQCQKLHSIQI